MNSGKKHPVDASQDPEGSHNGSATSAVAREVGGREAQILNRLLDTYEQYRKLGDCSKEIGFWS